jgi:hypothetical protein
LSTNWLLDAEPAPAILVLPPAAASLDEANAAIEMWEHYSRKQLDPTQKLTVQVMMAQADDGRWAAQTTGREMPRQNGKGDEIEVVELWGLVQRAERILHTIHDAVLLATEAQGRLLSVLDHPDLRRAVKRKWQGTGQQMIEMRNDGTIWYRTRTGGGGRGVDDVDRLVVDEAQHATEEHLSAVSPTLLANPNPQLNAAGTAALVGKSAWWWDMRIRALSGDPGDLGYVGHTAERVYIQDGKVVQEPVDVEDRSLWPVCNPALHLGRANIGFFEEQKRRLKDGFAAEHLGVWAPPDNVNAQAKIPADAWAATISSPPNIEPGQVTITFDVSKDGEWSSIAIGAGTIFKPYVEVIEHRKAVGWLPHRLVELVDRWKPLAVGCNAAGPAGGQVGPVLQAFRDAGVSGDLLHPMNASDYKSACGGFYTDVVEGRLRRPDGQGPLDVAVADAAERPLGDAWAWDARSATVPISPLVAVTIARALLPTDVPAAAPVFAY